ncbi:host specificity protein J, partial [Salmonella enterica]|nr:host specificity protein J [Salmonella enterica]
MSSGGGKASTPKLLDDNLKSKQFYRVLDLISEGPIFGPVDQEHLSSFKLNKTPVTDATGSVSVNGVSVAWRPGSETQSPINGFSAIEATTIVNTEVTYDTPLVRTITDQDVTRVRFNVGVTGLVEQDTKGNQNNTSVTMVLESRTGASGWVIEKTVTITGKISGEYLEAHLIDAPDIKPFDIRVRRITPDSSSDLLSNGTIWNSYSEITDDNLSYPFSAIAGAVIDRDQYTDTPSRTYHLRGLIVDVPDNYDPIARTYSGLWTGGFKKAWTNNPAWLFRELARNTRFGLAKRAGYIDIDDGALYVLSQYCDQLVNDGYGGQEPRMTLNAYITEQASARDILDKIASMFRGIALWDGMRLSVMLDAPQDPIATITNANVVDGEFKRSSVKRSEKYNAVVVSWTDPDNGWEQVKEYV